VATIVQTVGAAGTYATISAWLAAHPNPFVDGNLYIGELIDAVYEVDAGTLDAANAAGTTTSGLYRWLRSASGNNYRPERHTGARVYVRWTGSGDQHGFKITERFFRMSGFGIICEDPQEVTGGNKYGVRIEGDDALCLNMYVAIEQGGGRNDGTPVAPTFYCYYINGTGVTPATADNATFLNCIAQGSRYFKGASYGFYFDTFARTGALINCLANDITRGGAAARGYYTVPVQSTFEPKAVNCIATGTPFGFQGIFKFLVDPAFDPDSPLISNEPYQCIDEASSLPVTLGLVRPSGNRNGIDRRTLLGRPDIHDYRLLRSSFASRTGRDMTSIWAGYALSATDFDGTARPALASSAGGIGWTIGPYGSAYAPLASVAPTTEIKSIGSGAGRDYANIQAWLDATDDQSLPFVNKILIGELYDDADFAITAGQRVIARRTLADAAHYRLLRPAAGHGFDQPSGAGINISGTGGTTGGEINLVEVHESYFRLQGPVLVDCTNASASNRRALKLDGAFSRADAIYGRMIAGTGTANTVFRVTGSRILVTNCIARGSNSGSGGANTGFQVLECEFTRIYCCDSDRIKGSGSGNGFREGANTKAVEFANSIATDCTACFSHATAGTAPKTQSYCISSDTSADGVGAQRSTTAASLFRDLANADYRNASGSSALKRGGNLSARFSTDFTGRTRYAPFDIGAYEGLPTGPMFKAPQFIQSRSLMCLFEIYRRDGVLLLFSDQSEPVSYRGQTYKSAGSLQASNRRGEAGMRERSVSARGPITATDITKNDLAAGKYRGARTREIVLGKFPWTAPLEEQLYFWGDINFDAESWDGDFLSILNLLENNAGRQATVGCPLELGGPECNKDISQDTIDDVRVSATIQDNRRSFNAETADISASYADDFFGKGKVYWLTGSNAGTLSQVKSYTAATRTIVLEEAVPANIAQNHTFLLTPGCRKRFVQDCGDKYQNQPNFGGDPWMPGTDKTLQTPTR